MNSRVGAKATRYPSAMMLMMTRRKKKKKGPKAAAAATRDLVVLETSKKIRDSRVGAKATRYPSAMMMMMKRRKKKRSKSDPNTKQRMIPDDILIEILSWLPESSLPRLRYASKHWLSLTRDPLFVKLHLHRSRISTPCHIVTLSRHPGARPRITSIDYAGHRVTSDLSLPMDSYRMSPSCKGMVCIYSKNAAFLLNPTTGELLHLPTPTAAADSICLLGFSPATGKYKILRFYQQQQGGAGPAKCQVFPVGCCGARWRQPSGGIGGIGLSLPGDGATMDDEGVIYFICKNLEKLVSFDVEDEVFDAVKIPRFLADHFLRAFGWGGRLFQLLYFPDYCGVELWVLQGENWRLHSLFRVVPPDLPQQEQYILMACLVRLQYHDIKHYYGPVGKREGEDGNIMEDQHLVDAHALVPSFISLATL